MIDEILSFRRSTFIFLLLTAINIFLLTAQLSKYIRGFKDVLFYILLPSPANASKAINSFQEVSYDLKELVRVHQDNIVLRERINDYMKLESDWKRAFEENKRLREIIGFPEYFSKSFVVSNVITREPHFWYQWIIIDKGKNSGIRIDAPVVAASNNTLAAVGRVSEVYESYSKVVLITNILSALPIIIKSSGEDGLLEGQNKDLLKINYLVPKKHFKVNDKVVTSPISTVFPAYVSVGRIKKRIDIEDESFSSAIVEPAINFNKLREVMVVNWKKRK